MDYIISPSVMCMDLMNLGEQIKTLNKHVSMHHVDFIDAACISRIFPSRCHLSRPCARLQTLPSRCSRNANRSILLSG